LRPPVIRHRERDSVAGPAAELGTEHPHSGAGDVHAAGHPDLGLRIADDALRLDRVTVTVAAPTVMAVRSGASVWSSLGVKCTSVVQ